MIDTLLFDLDNTLLDFDKAEANALTKALHDVNIKVDDHMISRYNKINSSQWKLLEKGILTREEVKLRRFEILFEEFSINADSKEVEKNYQSYLGQGHYFIKDAEEVLEQLSKTCRIYLVTNGTLSVQRGRLQSSDIQGGKNAGIKTIWFHRQQDQTEKIEPKPDYEIRSLKELLKMLQ